ncbi:hypothetical protein BAE44_0010391 [Dichanthelium oligosanthes]|uniref:DUF1618 domain-containing protein n=1 Tax=Dichanthelium oligosanthes TaxID=888268 RepID=A0A1E5VU05_9POAL|nr:hypothetical protein BAE44_0010391 [Dichanthelium oligosanthes]
MERRPDWILINTIAVAGRNSNVTTATDRTRNGKIIEVSLSLEHPPHPSIVFVHSSDMNMCVPPDIIYTVEDLLLLAVSMGSGPSSISPDDCDYFIYRAHNSCPSLQRLQRPHPYFNDNDVGLLPRSDGQYTIAALITTHSLNHYQLYVFHSQIQSWSCSTVSVEAPQQPFPVKIPRRSIRIHRHLTSTVITIGGKGGTIGWVDHWRGILFCDVLDDKPSLRGVPLPLPLKELSENNGKGFSLGPGGQRRGIAFIRKKGCLKFVHLEVDAVRLPYKDAETGAFSFRVDNWALTTWSNKQMTDSYEDWHQDCTVKASDIRIDNPAISQALESGLLMPRPQEHGAAGEQLTLQNLCVSQPALCGNDENVIYLVARKKYRGMGAWILAIDMENVKILCLPCHCRWLPVCTLRSATVRSHNSSSLSSMSPVIHSFSLVTLASGHGWFASWATDAAANSVLCSPLPTSTTVCCRSPPQPAPALDAFVAAFITNLLEKPHALPRAADRTLQIPGNSTAVVEQLPVVAL